MRKLILLMRVSLDGFVEGPNGGMDWMDKDETAQWKDLFEVLEEVDLFLLGRVMWPDYRDYWTKALTNSDASQNEQAYARLAERTPHIIFSHTLKDAGWHNASIESGPVAEAVAKLKNMPGKNIQIVGGAKLAATLIDAGLVDEYRITVNPVVLLGGKSFFNQLQNPRPLKLVETKHLHPGVAILVMTPA